jgi:hypothetical protein
MANFYFARYGGVRRLRLLLMDKNESGTLHKLTARGKGFEEFMALIENPNTYTLRYDG